MNFPFSLRRNASSFMPESPQLPNSGRLTKKSFNVI